MIAASVGQNRWGPGINSKLIKEIEENKASCLRCNLEDHWKDAEEACEMNTSVQTMEFKSISVVTDSVRQSLAALSKLRNVSTISDISKLKFSSWSTEALLAVVNHFRGIESLYVWNYVKVLMAQDNDLVAQALQPTLKRLGLMQVLIHHVPLDDVVLRICQLPQLESLQLAASFTGVRETNAVRPVTFQDEQTTVSALMQMESLVDLSLRNLRLTDVAGMVIVNHLIQFDSLRSLDLRFNPRIIKTYDALLAGLVNESVCNLHFVQLDDRHSLASNYEWYTRLNRYGRGKFIAEESSVEERVNVLFNASGDLSAIYHFVRRTPTVVPCKQQN